MSVYTEGSVVGPYTLIKRINGEKWICQCNVCKKINEDGVLISNARKQRMCKFCRQQFNEKPKQDLVGMTFGRLIVVSYAGDSKWNCHCACGNNVVAATGHLKSGHTQSCGCYMKDRNHETHFSDLTGLRFNRLYVDHRIEDYISRKGKRITQYECICDCCVHIDVTSVNLINGNTTSCGCVKDSDQVRTIKQKLVESGIKFKIEHAFDDLKSSSGNLLRFDFVLFNQDDSIFCLIEHQGEEHFYSKERKTNFGKQAREETDNLKRNYCARKNLKLYETRYDEDVSKAISEIINQYYACQSRAKLTV